MTSPKHKFDNEFLSAQERMLDSLQQSVVNANKYYKKCCKLEQQSPLQSMFMWTLCNLTNTADAMYFLLSTAKGREALILAGHMIEGISLFLYARRERKASRYFDYMSLKCLKLHLMEEIAYGDIVNIKCRDADIASLKKYGKKFLKAKKKNEEIIPKLKDISISSADKIKLLKNSYLPSWCSDSIENIISNTLKDERLLYVYERYCQTKHHTFDNFQVCSCCNTVQIKDGLYDMLLAQQSASEVLEMLEQIGKKVV